MKLPLSLSEVWWTATDRRRPLSEHSRVVDSFSLANLVLRRPREAVTIHISFASNILRAAQNDFDHSFASVKLEDDRCVRFVPEDPAP